MDIDEIIQGVLLQHAHAIKKHPVFDGGKGVFQGVSVLMEEVGEVAQALNDGDHDHAVEELFQVAAVAFRFIDLLKK